MYNYEASKVLGKRVEVDCFGVPIEGAKKEGMSLWLAFVDGEREPRALYLPESRDWFNETLSKLQGESRSDEPPASPLPYQHWCKRIGPGEEDFVVYSRNAANTEWVLAEQENADR